MSENIHHLSGNLLVGSSHFFVDTTNNRVGITTTNPDAGLHVNSNAYVNTDFRVGTGIAMNVTSGRITAGSFDGDGSLLSGVNSDSGSWVNGSSSNVHLATSTNKVGIGRNNPACALDIAGEDVMIRGSTPSLNFSEGTGAMDGAFRLRYDGAYQDNNNNFLAIQTGASFGITALHCTYDGKVGIGTTSPDSSLDVNGIVTADNLDLDGTVIRSGADITLTAGTWAKIADFSSFATGGYYLISIKWSNSTLVSTGAHCIWYGGVTYSTYVVGGTGLYNATGQENITYNANYHYRTIDPFLFIQDSDASDGSYGKHSIYMKSPQSDVLAKGVAVVAYRIS